MRWHLCSSMIFLALAACASAPPAASSSAAMPHTIPPELAVPGGQLLLRVSAKGTQDYVCQAKADQSGFEWSFTGPEAELYDDRGALVGHHGAGPFWQLLDGSKVVGAVKQKVPVPGSVPLLLLEVKSSEGQGGLTGTTAIQRLDTSGGAAPAAGCDAEHVSNKVQIPYQASYLFYRTR